MTDYELLWDDHGDFLRGFCYRLTGSVADAYDVVQETFVRAIERPPADTARDWRPWLVRVASNLAKDLARRARRDYPGTWLPAPVETEGEGALSLHQGLDDVEGRYAALESVTVAFLLALEALTTPQRAVLLLRDVYDYSTRECAAALELTEANVKTTLHRARRALADYDERRRPPTAEIKAETAAALEKLLESFRDPRAMESLLAADVQALSDGGGRFHAAQRPVVGHGKVALFFSRIMTEELGPVDFQVVELNGLPALLFHRPDAGGRFASRWSFSIDVDANGEVVRTYSVLLPAKLSHLPRARAATG